MCVNKRHVGFVWVWALLINEMTCQNQRQTDTTWGNQNDHSLHFLFLCLSKKKVLSLSLSLSLLKFPELSESGGHWFCGANRSSKKMLRVAARKLSSLSSPPWRPNQVHASSALVSRHFINGGDSSSSGDPRSNGSAYSSSFGPDFHVRFRG